MCVHGHVYMVMCTYACVHICVCYVYCVSICVCQKNQSTGISLIALLPVVNIINFFIVITHQADVSTVFELQCYLILCA